LFIRIYSAIYQRRQSWINRAFRKELELYNAAILPAFDRIAEATGTKGFHVAKARDILKWLERVKPKHICELGSGRTTLVFAAYAAKNGASLTVFEQDARWGSLVKPLAQQILPELDYRLVPVARRPLGGRFEDDVPRATDFLYVDAPYVPKADGFPTKTGKPAYYDAADFLKIGGRPAIILIDGRIDAVDFTRTAALSAEFLPSFDWAIAHRKVLPAIWMARHSSFLF
jgi:hypothetical protein